ncbi:MAG: aminotransferase class I/II-fold pyridoxal phosphate-dependent enzyme [Actinomycetota bacterium]|nr:aminotransferase class I/II-fold pyridoxal phosphate-dependent enzyme [Actinomycetota bacterium]MDQ3901064.1 aminotransferase class I/II-fold pyridoxal phosphate-dependent enzyme [Actinomycetota bacterium]
MGLDALSLEMLRARRTMKWSRYPPDVLPAWVAEMDFPLAPPVLEAARGVLDAHDLGYSESAGLAEAFAVWASRYQGWWPDPALACPVADVMAGIEAALRVLTEPGDGVVLLTPAYPPFVVLLNQLGRVPLPWPLLDQPQGWVLDLKRLDDALRGGARGLLLCHPHNPTGRVFSNEELAAVSEIVDARGAQVISDEVHAPLVATDLKFTPYAASSPPAAAHSVTVTSISKGWNVPGLKCALLQAQPGTAQVVDAVPQYERLRASVPGVAASIAAWVDDGGWLDELRQHLDRTRAELAAWVRRTPGVRTHPATAGYLAWLDLRDAGLGDDPARPLLERGRLAVSPGRDFALPAEQGAGRVRLNHGTSLPLLREALRRIERTIEG